MFLLVLPPLPLPSCTPMDGMVGYWRERSGDAASLGERYTRAQGLVLGR